jgi:hypothetical protein
MATATTPPTGPQIGAQAYPLAFDVQDVKAQGMTEKNARSRYLITVKLENGQVAMYSCQSKSLKTAFEMIATISEQTKELNTPQKFEEYSNSMYGKRIWFDLSKNEGGGGDTAIAYKANRHGHTLEYAFKPTKTLSDGTNPHFRPSHLIADGIVQELKREAKFWQMQLDGPTLNGRDTTRIEIEKDNGIV